MSKQNPIRTMIAITPDDATDFDVVRGFYIGGDGDIRVDAEDIGTNILFTGVKAGAYYPFAVTRIYDTGTTATGIVALS